MYCHSGVVKLMYPGTPAFRETSSDIAISSKGCGRKPGVQKRRRLTRLKGGFSPRVRSSTVGKSLRTETVSARRMPDGTPGPKIMSGTCMVSRLRFQPWL